MSLGEQHQHARRRIFKNLEPFPHTDSFKRKLDYSMFFIGMLAPLALLPQVVEVFRTHDVGGLSLITFAVLGAINALWALYGAVHREKALFLANFFTSVLNFTITMGILLFR